MLINKLATGGSGVWVAHGRSTRLQQLHKADSPMRKLTKLWRLLYS